MTVRNYQETVFGPDAHHDILLSNIAVRAFDTNVDQFIGDQIFPAVPVGKRSDKYAIIDKTQFMSVPATIRAEKTEAQRIEFKVSSDSYFCDNHALAGELSLAELANVDIAFQLRSNTTEVVVTDLRRAQETRIANIVTSASNLGSGTTLSGANKWNDYVNSDPIGDVNTAHAFIRQNTGLVANTMMMDFDTWQIMRRHPQILDLFKYTSGGQATTANMQDVFNVGRILIGMPIMENAVEGATSSMTNIWGNNVLLTHTGPATGLASRTLGLRFVWRPSGYPAPFSVSRRVESGAGTKWIEIIEAQQWQDEKIIASELGYLIASTL